MSENANLAPGTGTGRAAIGCGALTVLGLAAAVLIATLLFGQHGGEEFARIRSPDVLFLFPNPLGGHPSDTDLSR